MDARAQMERAASFLTRQVGKRWGESFPFYYVMEFPKSGGSWLSDMIADYLQIPRPVLPVFPIGCRAVIHGHWAYSPKFRRVFYLYRDGRDVVVSLYFRVLQQIRDPRLPSVPGYHRRHFPSLFAGEKPPDIRVGLPAFIEEVTRSPGGTWRDWSRHIEDWAFERPHVVSVSYEELLLDPETTLTRVLPVHTGEPVDSQRLKATIFKYSFEQQTGGRKPGLEDRTSVLRKGVAGDWRNHFTRAAGEAFDRFHGPMLRRLGYEKDGRWVAELPE